MKKYLLLFFFCACFLFSSCSKTESRQQISTPKQETAIATTSSSSKHDIYAAILNSSLGPITYYNQNDIRWYQHLYGGEDALSIYGCGPTTLACLVSSFIDPQITPDKMADWAAENGFWASRNGSYHTIIPEGLSSFGFQVASIKNPSKQTILSSLNSNHILVALMGKGHFTEEGHFILILGTTKNGKLHIADVNSYDNTKKTWNIKTIIKELKMTASAGGPLWEVSLPKPTK